MATFLAAFFLVTGLLLVCGVPVFVLAWRKGRTKTARRFLVAAAVLGLFSAAVAAASERLENQCQAAGNTNCIDYGVSGSLLIVVVGYLIVSLATAVMLSRE